MANRILVTDDEEAVGESRRKTLDGEGYEIEIAYRGTNGRPLSSLSIITMAQD